MRVSVWGGADVATVSDTVARVQQAADEGFGGVWFPQTAALDALTCLAVAADRVPGIRLGTAVVPIQGRHPLPLAQQALTVADVAGPDRFTLGVGVTHAPVSEGWYGIPYASVVRLCEEELTALDGLLSPQRHADVEGRHLTARVTLQAAGPRPGLLLAALGPRMLALAGRLTDGTVTWMTGPRTLARDVVPTIRRAAAEAGRPQPRVVAGLAVCLSDDADAARARVARAMAGAAQLASYRRMLAVDGAADPGGIALTGDEEAVDSQLRSLAAAGVTEVLANVIGDAAERQRTRRFLAAWSDGGSDRARGGPGGAERRTTLDLTYWERGGRERRGQEPGSARPDDA